MNCAFIFAILINVSVLVSASNNSQADNLPDADEVLLLQQSLEIQVQVDAFSNIASGRNAMDHLEIAGQTTMSDVADNKPTNLLVLIVSCHKYRGSWSLLRDWGASAHPHGSILILAGLPDGASALGNNKQYELSLLDGTLFVNSSDAYEHLPEKMMRAFTSVFNAPELQHITHVLKIDDKTIEEEDGLPPFNFNAEVLETAIASVKGDYISSPRNYAVVNCGQPHWQYAFNGSWRAPTCSYTLSSWKKPPSHGDRTLYLREYQENTSFAYANGGWMGYVLSRRALGLIATAWPLDRMHELAFVTVLEDRLVGATLYKAGVQLTTIRIKSAARAGYTSGDSSLMGYWGEEPCYQPSFFWIVGNFKAGIPQACCHEPFQGQFHSSGLCPNHVQV